MSIQLIQEYLLLYPILQEIALGILLLLASAIIHLILKKYVLRYLYYLFCQTKHTWDQTLFEQKVFNGLPYLIPAMILYQGAALLPSFQTPARAFIHVWFVFIIISFIDRLLTGLHFIYTTYPVSLKRPLKAYLQVAKLLLYLVGGIFVVSILFDQSPLVVFSGLGALTAVLLLVFRDTLLSFITSIQLMGNDLIRVGDWIEMPKYGADGAVTETALHAIKVRNWDNTITVIPTYRFSEDSFKNWRGMSESGGRRIKRSVLIDQTSICFCTPEMIEKFAKIEVLTEYIQGKLAELAAYNQEHEVEANPINGRRLTNIGTFRAYIERYLKRHPMIHQDLIMLIRQLDPTTEGLPLEIYVFVNDVRWVNYENVQSDIFDHILAIAPEFGLRIFQKPTGYDLKEGLHEVLSLSQTFPKDRVGGDKGQEASEEGRGAHPSHPSSPGTQEPKTSA